MGEGRGDEHSIAIFYESKDQKEIKDLVVNKILYSNLSYLVSSLIKSIMLLLHRNNIFILYFTAPGYCLVHLFNINSSSCQLLQGTKLITVSSNLYASPLVSRVVVLFSAVSDNFVHLHSIYSVLCEKYAVPTVQLKCLLGRFIICIVYIPT